MKTNYIIPNGRTVPPGAHNKYNYHNTRMRSNLIGMNTRLMFGVAAKCICPANKRCASSSEPSAYTREYIDRTIRFCPRFFQESPESRATTFMHELSHIAVHTDDLFVTPWDPMGWKKASRDAHYIDYFAACAMIQVKIEEEITIWQVLFPP